MRIDLPLHPDADVPVALWDLDNCLFDDNWRIPLIDMKLTGNDRYRVYNDRMLEDLPTNLDIWEMYRSAGVGPIFVTGRSEEYEQATRMQIEKHLALRSGYGLVMRPLHDSSKPADMKLKMLIALFAAGLRREQIVAAFDDVEAIVSMYRAFRIPAFHLFAQHDSKAYTHSDIARADATMLAQAVAVYCRPQPDTMPVASFSVSKEFIEAIGAPPHCRTLTMYFGEARLLECKADVWSDFGMTVTKEWQPHLPVDSKLYQLITGKGTQ